MKLLVLGGDGRAHALVWKLFNSSQVTELLCLPGNGGTGQLAPAIDLDPPAAPAVARYAFEHGIDLILPADSAFLHSGLVDEAVSFQVGVCGPSQRSAVLERSRCAAKSFLLRHNLPTPNGRACRDPDTAERFLATQPMPVIVKGDSPALGERVYQDRFAAIEGVRQLFRTGPLTGASEGVVVESYIAGPRVVLSAFTDGRSAVPLLPVRLYDRVAEDDSGEQAHGIGAHTSNTRYAQLLADFMHQRIIQPIVAGLATEGLPYWGMLSVSCVIAPDGPKVTALRSSFHQGEAQVVLPRLEDDLLPWLRAMVAQRLHELPAPRFAPEASVGLGLFARGYPNYFASGGPISGLEDLDGGVLAFHSATENPAGLRSPAAGAIFGFGGAAATPSLLRTSGGLPITLVASAATLASARERVLANATRI
ncbi:MAG: phosphoribosylamine--glycine ligase, partial [Roseiflexaceae bacterium]|nr:phosphoribosylamine--glycine ligase [Roseiflexaceae bacterium]